MTNLVVYAQTRPFWQPTELVTTLLSRGAREVIRHWVSHRRYLGADNQPIMLALDASEQGFDGLVQQVSCHLAPIVIRNELLRKGIVEEHDNGTLLLRRSAYIQGLPDSDNDQGSGEMRLAVGRLFGRRHSDSI